MLWALANWKILPFGKQQIDSAIDLKVLTSAARVLG